MDGVVAPTVPLMLIDAVPVRFVTVPDEGVPRAPLKRTTAPADPVFTARAVATPVPSPVIPPTATADAVPAVRPAAVPVIFVPTSVEGVPRFGVTRVGDVARTTAPEPVVDAAEIAVPFPERMPVTVVERVMAGVVVLSATVPAKPFAETTETSVTVPDPDAASVRRRPVVASIRKGSTVVALVLERPPATVILFSSRINSMAMWSVPVRLLCRGLLKWG